MTRISARFLKKQYPALWRQVYDQVLNDVYCSFRSGDFDSIPEDVAKRYRRMIAHNAAFAACDAHHYGVEK